MRKENIPGEEKNSMDFQQYCASDMQRDIILERLRKRGCRITRQRELLIDIILQEDCMNCKEIYYSAVKKLPKIGMATIYRTVSALEEIGALHKRSIYRLKRQETVKAEECLIRLEDDTCIKLDAASLNYVIEKGMQESGVLKGKRVRMVLVKNGEI